MKLLKAMVMGTAIMMMSQVVMAVDSVGVNEMPELVYREPPYANMFSPTSTDASDMADEWWDNEEFWESDDDTRSASCTDYCHYNTISGVNDEIHCEVPSTFYQSDTIVGMNRYNEAGDQVIMCMYNPIQGWVRVGSCDLDGLVKLRVDGSSGENNIAIIKTAMCETDPCDEDNDCDFAEFINDFSTDNDGELHMDGKGACDGIWGSQYSDMQLIGEYVTGLEGDDYINLTADDVTCVGGHPSALGNEGSDMIHGAYDHPDHWGDYVWADDVDVSLGAGTDHVYTYDRADYIYLGYGDWDTAKGGDDVDCIWGGPGNYDHLWGGNGNDHLFGGDGGGDWCKGEVGYDECVCETRIDCEY